MTNEVGFLQYIRKASRKRQLEQVDIKLLAHLPYILGSEVFGHVEECGPGHRWTFAAAGVDVHSGAFVSEADAQDELAVV